MQVGLCDGAPAELLFGQPPYETHIYFHFQESAEERGRKFGHYSVLMPWDKSKGGQVIRLPQSVLVAALVCVCVSSCICIYIYIHIYIYRYILLSGNVGTELLSSTV